MNNKLYEVLKFGLVQVGVLFFLFTLLILIVEFRYWYKYAIKYPRNNFNTVTWGHEVRNNRWGFRERDFDISTIKKADFFTVVVLGDSLTWGAGLEESERYSNLLEGHLQSEYPNKKIMVINFGVSGGPTTMEQNIYGSIYQELKPNLTIVGFCLNDPQEKSQDYSKERETFFSKIEPKLNFLDRYHMKGTAKHISKIYENMLLASKKIPRWTEALDRVYDVDSIEWNKFSKALEKIAQMSQEISTNPPIFISLNQGTFDRTLTDYNHPNEQLKLFLKWYHQAELAASKSGFIAINCEKEFNSLGNHMLQVVPKEDGHPTAEMNKIYAQKLFSVIKENNFVNK